MAKVHTKPIVFDLFSGAGVFASAFQMENFHIGQSVEMNPIAAATAANNLGHIPEVSDIRKVKPQGYCDVIIAGPPCQGFSTIGRPSESDLRNSLGFEVVKWTKSLLPKVVVIENVPPFLKSSQWKLMKRRFEEMGYEVQENVFNAFDFGAAQLRSRCICIVSKSNQPKIKKLKAYNCSTVREAWTGLPRRPDGKNNHYAPPPSDLTLKRLKYIPPEGDRTKLIMEAPRGLVPPSLMKLGSSATDVWGRMIWNRPANTIRTCVLHPSKGRYLHPSQDRTISLREAARLQSIDDSWFFEGTPYQVARQIGNSVPVALGRAVARGIYSTL